MTSTFLFYSRLTRLVVERFVVMVGGCLEGGGIPSCLTCPVFTAVMKFWRERAMCLLQTNFEMLPFWSVLPTFNCSFSPYLLKRFPIYIILAKTSSLALIGRWRVFFPGSNKLIDDKKVVWERSWWYFYEENIFPNNWPIAHRNTT